MTTSIPRMRTASGAVALLKELDPGSQVTEHYVRQLIRSGKLSHVDCGTKKLVNVDQLIDHLRGDESI